MWKIFQVNPNAIRSSVAESSAVWRTMPSCCFFFVPRHQKIELTDHLISVWCRPFISGRSGLSTLKKQRATLKLLCPFLDCIRPFAWELICFSFFYLKWKQSLRLALVCCHNITKYKTCEADILRCWDERTFFRLPYVSYVRVATRYRNTTF